MISDLNLESFLELIIGSDDERNNLFKKIENNENLNLDDDLLLSRINICLHLFR